MRTNKEQYISVWGESPRGHGLWIIQMEGTDGEGRFTTYTGEAWGTLTEAKQSIARAFKQEVGGVKKIIEATVLP